MLTDQRARLLTNTVAAKNAVGGKTALWRKKIIKSPRRHVLLKQAGRTRAHTAGSRDLGRVAVSRCRCERQPVPAWMSAGTP